MVIKQDQNYHNFVDQRPWWGWLPNGNDVVSNLPFLVFGLMGLWCMLGDGGRELYYPWLVFFSGSVLVALGSAYYHWRPCDRSLVWDRLPMTLMFMSFFLIVMYVDGGDWVRGLISKDVIGWLIGLLFYIELIDMPLSSSPYIRYLKVVVGIGVVVFCLLVAQKVVFILNA